ncbi:MAG: Gfo/Idh/MocA family oxidoreductase [Clostridia bacterium]|nr:Gfo/Idh/MocA family oxidoreductase [Clostridia bacterium]
MKKIKVGIFGYCRGEYYVDNFLLNNADIVAVCEKRPERLSRARKKLGGSVKLYTDFDEFIEHKGLDAVLLANYFHEHTEYAIRCLEKNIHVLSECISNATMAEGVRLVEATEKSKAHYMLAENYPYMLFNQEMKRVYDNKTLGKCLYAEGEYNHAGNPYEPLADDSWLAQRLYDSTTHWRCFNPRTYYVTHSLAPIMYITGAKPVRVTAMPVYAPLPDDCNRAPYSGDCAAIITTLNDDDSVFKFTGCATFGASDNSYRLCCKNGQIENVRGSGGKVMLRYDSWHKPEGMEEVNYYMPTWDTVDAELIKNAGHGGGDFCVVREFLNSIKEDRQHPFDVYFSTRMASVAILGHRSLMEYGMPYDIPDFSKKEDRDKYRNDDLSPYYYSDGRTPTIPCCSHPDYKPSELQIANFKKALEAPIKD